MGAVVLGRLTEVPRPRLVGWAILVGVLALVSYAANLASDGDPPDDVLYRWSSAAGGLIQYGIILAIVLALCRGIAPATLGLRRPASWRKAAGLMLGALVAIWIIGAVLNLFLEAGEEQGLVPDGWDSDRAVPFAANFVVVAVVAPVVEELTYRGLGFAAVRDAFGAIAAVLVTAFAFGLAHGLVVALPVLTIFGAILGWLRWRTDSIYPPMLLHGVFNGAALIAAVTV
jgi:membrane protease YdiL (CAAX protease family)